MNDESTQDPPTIDFNLSFKNFKPWITISVCIICLIPFIGLNLEKNPLTWNIYAKWGAPSPSAIWDGSYWGLFTTNFVHLQLWHIGFNLFWFWNFGKKIEYQSTNQFYILLIISSGFICSAYQILFSASSGIGWCVMDNPYSINCISMWFRFLTSAII